MYLNMQVRLAICTRTLSYATLFALLILIQPIFDQSFDEADSSAKLLAVIANICTFKSHKCKACHTLRDASGGSLLPLRTDCSLRLRLARFCTGLLFALQSLLCRLCYLANSAFFSRFYSWQSECLGIKAYQAHCEFAASATGDISTVKAAILASIFNR